MEWIEPRGKSMPIIGQPTLMECWITCYQMMFKASGVQWNAPQIEAKLVAGGFADAKQARIAGVGDADLLKCAQALGIGYKKTSELTSLAATKMMMQLHGPLWVAGKFKGSDNGRYKHIVMAIGIEEKLNRIGLVNPWQENMWDNPTIGWMMWDDFKKAIHGTANIEASLQYLNMVTALKLKASDSMPVIKTATFHRTNVFAR